MKKALEGVKVADFGWALVGPATGKIFSDYGAEVIKIEGRKRFDNRRLAGAMKDGVRGLNRGGQFAHWNTGKLSVAVNLACPRGVELAKRIVAWADVVNENFAGGAIEKMGLGYEELKKVKPDIIMLGSCMMGHTGPHLAHPGFGPNLTAISGFISISGWTDRTPIPPEGPYTDFIAPRFSVCAIIAALLYRRRTGKGQYIDMSQFENSVHLMAPLILDYNINHRVAGMMGNRSSYAAPHGAYRCRGEDSWCAIAVYNDEEWNSFCRVMGNPEWTKNIKFATLLSRKNNEDELEKLVGEWTVHYSAEEVMQMMQSAGVAAGILETTEDIMEHDPQLKYRHLYWELDHPEIGKHHPPGSPFILSKSPCEVRRAPLVGEHNNYVLKEILGISDKEIGELVKEGVIE